jgi:hypothetical protein
LRWLWLHFSDPSRSWSALPCIEDPTTTSFFQCSTYPILGNGCASFASRSMHGWMALASANLPRTWSQQFPNAVRSVARWLMPYMMGPSFRTWKVPEPCQLLFNTLPGAALEGGSGASQPGDGVCINVAFTPDALEAFRYI